MTAPDLPSVPMLRLHVGAREGGLGGPGQPEAGVPLVLVQPDPDQAAALRRAAPEAEVLAVGLAAEEGRADLLQMNFTALNSFQEPTPALRAIFPGLKVTRRQSVPVLSPGALLDRIGAREQVIDLVLEAPGSEMRLLELWKAADALKLVRELVLRCGSEVFFDGAAARGQIEAWLATEGFTRMDEDLSDPDWPVTRWQADPARRALKAALAEAESRAESAEAALSEARKATEVLQADHKALIEKAEWRQKRIKELEAEAVEAASALSGLEERAGATQTVLSEAEARATTAESRAQSAESALSEARKATEALQADHKALVEKADWRRRRIEELEAQVREIEKTREAERKETAEDRTRYQNQEQRLAIARNDLRRAEGQIELIKDLLLRGETL